MATSDKSFDDLYTKLGELGEGGFGTVFKVKHKATNKLYAAKTMRSDKINSSTRRSLQREIDILKKINHESIVKLHCHFVENNRISIVMELCPGGNLRSAIRKQKQAGKPFSDDQLMPWSQQILSAVVYLYNNHIIHRDIKPENILLTATLTIKLTDFGLSRIQGEQ